jgi:hypothetical protein
VLVTLVFGTLAHRSASATVRSTMATHTRIVIAALIAATALAVGVGTAAARRIAASENHFLSHFRELTFETSAGRIICAVSIEGSFHERTIEKIVGGLIGYISEARVKRPCSGGETWIQSTQERGPGELETLPWHILYERFIGALPNITGIEITSDGTAFLLLAFGIRCLYRATTTSPIKGIIKREASGKATGLRSNSEASIPKAEGSFLCPGSGRFLGEGIVGKQVGYSEITVTLVA